MGSPNPMHGIVRAISFTELMLIKLQFREALRPFNCVIVYACSQSLIILYSSTWCTGNCWRTCVIIAPGRISTISVRTRPRSPLGISLFLDTAWQEAWSILRQKRWECTLILLCIFLLIFFIVYFNINHFGVCVS